MPEKRVQLNQIVKNQLPSYVQEDFPLVGEFLSQYYQGQEYKGGPADLIQNIDSYVKLSECGSLIKSTNTTAAAGISTSTIFVSNTTGFPDNYGLIKINDEIITYETKTEITTETDMATAISRNNCPTGRSTIKTGIKTTTVVNAEPKIGFHTCNAPFNDAFSEFKPD